MTLENVPEWHEIEPGQEIIELGRDKNDSGSIKIALGQETIAQGQYNHPPGRGII